MRYKDPVYGTVDIVEDVICEIIMSEDFQRLRGVDQAGYFETFFPGTCHSRFEHSVGCCILLKMFGASIEEQIAGLIHDVSHSAFSHTADYVFAQGRGGDQNYQDDIFLDFVHHTKIPSIIEKNGFDPVYVLDSENFPLQETQLPDLCADRIDYALRGLVHYRAYDRARVQYFIQHLCVQDARWAFDAYHVARAFAQEFKVLNDVYYSNKETAAMFHRTSQWLLHAVHRGYIDATDLYARDKIVIDRINEHLKHDRDMCLFWQQMNDPHIKMGKKNDPDVIDMIVKSRVIDPLFYEGARMYRVSDRDPVWGPIVQTDMQPKHHYLKVVHAQGLVL